MAIVLPDGILTNATLQYVRDFIMNNFKINAIVSIPQTAFSHYGAGVKCSLLFLTKSIKNKEDYDIFMAQAEYVGYDATGREIEQNDLNEIFNNYKNFIEKKNFKLNDKCFLIKFNKLKNSRLDVSYSISKDIFNNYSTISDYCDIFGGKRIPIGHKFVEKSKFRYLKVDNIDAYGFIDNYKMPYISEETFSIIKNFMVKNGDIIISIAGTIGKVSLINNIPDNTILTENCAKIIINDKNNLNSAYLSELLKLDIMQKYIKENQIQTTIPKLSLQRLRNLKIPLPPLEEQESIANIMKKAYLKKEEFEKEADKLLSSIDEYLLRELDIKINDNKKKNTFIVKSNELKGKRIDTFWYSLGNMFYKSKKFENKKLSDLVNIQKGETITSNTKEDGDIPVIAGGKVPAYYNNKSNYKGNVITISASGSSGYVWWHDNPIWASDCNVLTEKSKEANIKYIYHILKFNQENIYKLQKGSVQSHVYASDLAEIIIPTPPIEIQQKIVNEINERKQKALRLQKEAKETLENAKSKIEEIIFK